MNIALKWNIFVENKIKTQRTLLEFYTDAYHGPKQYGSLSFSPIDGAAFLMNYIMSGIAQVRLL